MYFFGFCLVSLLFSANARFHPIDHNFINTFDTNNENAAVNYRLPNNTKPESYEITLRTRVDKGQFNFTGNVNIYIEVLEENTKTITLHARQLTFGTITLKQGTSEIDLKDHAYDTETEFLTIPLKSDTLIKGRFYYLNIEYSGELRKDMGGFYRSSYINANNETIWLGTTQFESTDARHAFPCYDEPQIKATFTIHIEHGDKYSAISNMDVKGSPVKVGEDGLKTTFVETGKMSTYLIAFMVSDFKYTESKITDDNPTAQRVFAQPGYVNQTNYALSEGVAILNAIAKYVNVPFQPKQRVTPKMDQAAIPQFKAGAMENWGLVTYREEMLLFDAAIHLPSRQLSITTTIAHEFGHQWFGDLVSPLWWSYIWLNEGFATIFEAIGTNAVHPTWDIWTYFVSSKVQPVLRVDAESNSRPMTFYAENPAGIQNLFDNIAYAKSGSVIRMFMHALGEDTFKKGLNYYLQNMSNSAATEDDLFNHLNTAAQEDKKIGEKLTVKELFGSWSNQVGFPVLKVSRSENGSIVLSQEKYDTVQQNETSKSTWWIPYNFGSASYPNLNDTKPSGWLEKNQTEAIIEWKENESKWNNSDWVLFNTQQTGYYRVWYDDTNYDLLNKELNEGKFDETIHPLNRAQILDDLQEFVTSGRVSPKNLCNTMTYLAREKSYAPWTVAKRAITEWNQHLQASEKLSTFQRIVQSLVQPYYEQVKLIEEENDEILDKLARNTAVNLACEFGVSKCLDDTYSEFQKIISGNKTSQNVRGIIVGNGIRKANAEEIEKLWNQFLDSSSNDERQEIITSLGNIQDESILELYLKKSIEDFAGKTVSAAEREKIITTINGGGQHGVSLTINFLKDQLENVNKKLGSVSTIMTNVAKRVLTTEMQTKFTEVLDLAKTKEIIDNNRYKQLQEIVTKEIEWQNGFLKKFEEEFFVGKCAGNSLAAIPLLLFILFAITRWN